MNGPRRWFQPFVCSPDLRHLLACRYVASSAGHHELLPDGCMDLVWTGQPDAVLCGPDTQGWSFDMADGQEMAGVRFRAGAAAGVFRVEATDLRDRRVALADLVGARTARQLAEQLAGGRDEDRMGALEDFVRPLVTDVDPMAAVAAHVKAHPATAVDTLADRAGLSPRQLRRRFDRAVGYGPAFLARIARLQRFATAALRHPGLGIAELAVAAGYVDQAHLAKDVRAFADRTPVELVATLDRSSLAVGVGLGVDVVAGGATDGRSVQDSWASSRSRWAA